VSRLELCHYAIAFDSGSAYLLGVVDPQEINFMVEALYGILLGQVRKFLKQGVRFVEEFRVMIWAATVFCAHMYFLSF
jgi:hypothetical protein